MHPKMKFPEKPSRTMKRRRGQAAQKSPQRSESPTKRPRTLPIHHQRSPRYATKEPQEKEVPGKRRPS